ncbi:MAG TPA: large conductance mechanosensitive channel protein MscL [Casimicrobiaceae bacterium]|nr:large conductance mechanosensitive channel protein MscL [Casimicrobiaceae bacterium]
MTFRSEFREFALKGNVMDLAVGVIIGAAFSKIIDSLVKDVVMPIISVMTGGGVDFSNKYWILAGNVPAGAPLDVAQKAGTVLAWGSFVTIVINFIILALVIFWMVKAMNRARRKQEVAAAPTPEDTLLLREIRDRLQRT